MSEKSMYDKLDFGTDAAKDVDTKLAILKFNYSWVTEVEREERIIKDGEKQPLETTDNMKQLQSDEDKSFHGQSVLDFGEEPVKNLDAKLEILEFNYSWVDEVEKEERMAEEANERALEAADFTKQKQWVSDGENRTIYGQEFLDFGEEPVKSLDAKLDVLKFTYSWATEVEENERRKEEETRLQTKGQEYGVEREIQKAVPKEDAQVKAPEKPQEVTSENQRNGITEKLKDPLQEKEMDKDLSKPAELCKDEKPEPDVYQHGQNLSNIQQLTDDEEDHFIPRRLFLFGITEFKNDARQITTCNEMSVPIVGCPVNEYSTTSTTCTSEATMATVCTNLKKSLRRRIKKFLGFNKTITVV